MTQKSNLYRRSSGIYVVRITVPERLRRFVGKGEIHISTGSRTPGVAKAVAAGTMAHWRQRFLALSGIERMDIERLSLGSPLLEGAGYLSLPEAAEAAGFTEEELLRKGSEGRLTLHARLTAVTGHVLPQSALEVEHEGDRGVFVVPASGHMPANAVVVQHTGVLRVRSCAEIASALLSRATPQLVLFDLPTRPGHVFAPDRPVELRRSSVELAVAEVEALRVVTLASVTPEQLLEVQRLKEGAVAARRVPAAKGMRISDATERYMSERSTGCAEDRTRRLRDACNLFADLMGDPLVSAVTRDMLRTYRDEYLPKVPAKLHLLRPKHPEIAESITAAIEVVDSKWPRISELEQRKRMGWLAGLFAWLSKERLIEADPAEGLVQASAAQDAGPKKRKHRKQDSRDDFTKDDLHAIFSASWFKTGQGQINRAGTYREFMPLYYWLPLLGLHTGARINELCQLKLTDIKQTPAGVWYFDINDGAEDQSVKNSDSVRNVPLHPLLLQLGLIEWRSALHGKGYDRLFPELKYDPTKGYSKAAVKWFSAYLGRLGWERDGRKTFHSFRHTFVTRATNNFGIPPQVIGQITGHDRGVASGIVPYMKNQVPDAVVPAIELVRFDLPPIEAFDVQSGLVALGDALRRKKSARFAAEIQSG